MKKVVYSVSRNNRFGSNKLTGVGFITDADLIIACVSKKGNAYSRVFEDCVKNCHAIQGRDGEFKGNRSRVFHLVQVSRLRRLAMNKFYLKEFQFFDGEDTVIFNIVAVESEKITVAVTRCGKITVTDYDLHSDENGLYFEYGVAGQEHIHIDDFEEA